VFGFIIEVSVGLVFLGHLLGFVALVRNQRWMTWPPQDRQRSKGDKAVTVIVPARNEAGDIAECLRSLLMQDYPNLKVIVVNDHSADETPRIIDEIAAEVPRLITIHNPPLRPGWLGKHNAMQSAWEQVDSDLVLLTDADVKFEPTCISLAVGELERRRLDFLSLYPQFQFISFCETLLLPIYVGGAAILLSPAVEDPRYRHAMATGAFILMRPDRLREVGGLESIKTDILDDIVMAQRFKEHGFAIGLRSAPDLMRVRFFKNNRHAFFGATKHLLGSLQHCSWLIPLVALIPLVMYGVLLLGIFYGIANGHFFMAGVSVLTLVIHYAGLLVTRPGNEFSALKALGFPLVSVQFAASGLRAAYLLLAKGTFQWRGRSTNLRKTHVENIEPSHAVKADTATGTIRESSTSARWS
jgi:glycosyltransferase involved in cell wall biosynthesis